MLVAAAAAQRLVAKKATTKAIHKVATTTTPTTAMKFSLPSLALLGASAQICGAFQQKSHSFSSTALKMSSSDGFPFNPPINEAWGKPLKEGDTVPSVTFKTRVRIESDDPNPFDWKDVTSDSLMKGKRVVLFGLPGAFTPL
mmetsp:Transcript_23445/g.27123  ORF Transcript_23445/g.27123 Transcript_23445/m.27123 type:complete len:142 (+) Transcript_23445:157-582(+)|eukprot:CAMPEP_0170805184 /NCGR_PEP_ID=MMETSP0733-20121128/31225_1 /TAXON_ID=186038 /ORGANISM="Fragilariopsis kerguelensis, Strain L26-C5" /LENGTH=141 /DNA_ID=CAMNT_0011159529 /DNA_START=152 /DNA_END=577 /DNA_ORIENTATION=+